MSSIAIHELDVPADAVWRFHDSAPTWQHRHHGSMATFDPFPAYPHRRADVDEAAAHVEQVCPPLWDVELYIANREEVGRSNGFSSLREGGHYEGSEWVKDPPTGLIMLSGKRVPPHPAVTRYLVAHEYGHNVEWMLNLSRGAKHVQDETLIREYARLRLVGADPDDPNQVILHGTGGVWHQAVTELFACDFRLLACEVEPDYWPHPRIPRPDSIPGLAEWWHEALRLLDEKRIAA